MTARLPKIELSSEAERLIAEAKARVSSATSVTREEKEEMTSYRPLQFQQRLLPVNGEKPQFATYLVGNWHSQILMSPAMLSNSPVVRVDENGMVVIEVANGSAVYKLSRRQPDAGRGLALERVRYEQRSTL